MSVPNIILSSCLSVWQILSNWVQIWRSSDKNQVGSFFWPTLYDVSSWSHSPSSALFVLGLWTA